jgi:hypothetical protein
MFPLWPIMVGYEPGLRRCSLEAQVWRSVDPLVMGGWWLVETAIVVVSVVMCMFPLQRTAHMAFSGSLNYLNIFEHTPLSNDIDSELATITSQKYSFVDHKQGTRE